MPSSRPPLVYLAALALASCPGPALEPAHALATVGAGDCTGSTLATVIDRLHDAEPDLARCGLDGDLGGADPTRTCWIAAFRRDDGGFALAVALVTGDCGPECNNHLYRYYRTDAACAPARVGEYGYRWTYTDPRCWRADGAPLWGVPPPLRPASACRD